MIELLPHELGALLRANDGFLAEQKELAAEQADAVGGGSDWHDNGGYDEVLRQRERLDNRHGRVLEVLNEDYRLVDYPGPDDDRIRLGSLVLSLDKFGNPAPFIIVGQNKANNDAYREAWKADRGNYWQFWGIGEDEIDPDKLDEFLFLNVIAPGSELGKAALDRRVGDTLAYRADVGMVTFTALGIDQSWVKNRFETAADEEVAADELPLTDDSVATAAES